MQVCCSATFNDESGGSSTLVCSKMTSYPVFDERGSWAELRFVHILEAVVEIKRHFLALFCRWQSSNVVLVPTLWVTFFEIVYLFVFLQRESNLSFLSHHCPPSPLPLSLSVYLYLRFFLCVCLFILLYFIAIVFAFALCFSVLVFLHLISQTPTAPPPISSCLSLYCSLSLFSILHWMPLLFSHCPPFPFYPLHFCHLHFPI